MILLELHEEICVILYRYCFSVLTAISVVALVIAVIPAAKAASEIVITDQSQGCFHNKKTVNTFDRKGDVYVSAKGQVLKLEQLKELLAAIDASANYQTLNLAALGVTPEAVTRHRDDILSASLKDISDVPMSVQEKNSYLLDYGAICQSLKHRLVWHDVSTTHEHFTIVVKDRTLGHGQDHIEVSSTHGCPWMLPWSVRMGERRWKTYSTALPLALSSLADKAGPCASWLDGRHYWQEDLWKDSDFWSSAVGSKLRSDRDTLVAEQLDGYSEAARLFAIERCTIAALSHAGSSLSMRLRVLHPEVISSVSWLTLLNNGKIGEKTQTWSQMLPLYSKCESAIKAHKWLCDWRAAGADRSVQCEIAGNNCYSDDNKDFNKLVLPVWRAAKLKGVPEVEVNLERGKYMWCGRVYLSSSDPRALVVYAQPEPGTHWFDKQDISWERPAHYIVVQPSGKFERHRLTK